MTVPALRSILDIKRYDTADTPLDERAGVIGRSLYTKIPDWDLIERMRRAASAGGPGELLEGSTLTTEAVLFQQNLLGSLNPTADLPSVTLKGVAPGTSVEVDCIIYPEMNFGSPADISLNFYLNGVAAVGGGSPFFQLQAHALRVKMNVTIPTVGETNLKYNAISGLVAVVDGSGTSTTAAPAWVSATVPHSNRELVVGARITWSSGADPFGVNVLKWDVVGRKMG